MLVLPVLAINSATYWYALRDNGIEDTIEGFGPLLTDFTKLPENFAATPRAAAE